MMKKKLLISIDENLDRDFRSFLAHKYGKVERGLISNEIAEAIKYWISIHTQEHKLDERRIVIKPRHLKVWMQIKDYLLMNYYQELKTGQEINGRHLREAISVIRGSDKRTIKKWLNLFRRFGYIEHVTGAIWRIRQ